MRKQDRNKLREMAEKATPGPWEEIKDDDWACRGYYLIRSLKTEEPIIPTDWNDEHFPAPNDNDCAYIAAASPDKILDLLYMIEELEKEVSKWADRYGCADSGHQHAMKLNTEYRARIEKLRAVLEDIAAYCHPQARLHPQNQEPGLAAYYKATKGLEDKP